MVWASRVTNVAHLGNFSPGHGRKFSVQINDELAHLFRQRLARFSRSALLPRGEQALHPVSFKLIRFAGQRALGDTDFFCSLPCGFVEQDQGSDLFVELLLRPQRPLLNTPHSSVRARRSLFGPGISPCLSQTTMRISSVPNPSKV